MSISYSLHTVTDDKPDAVLSGLFGITKLESIPNANVKFVRGGVFLAHGKPTDQVTQARFSEQFEIIPTVSVLFFPDGVSDYETALDILAEATYRWLTATTDDLILVANNTELVFKRQQGKITSTFDSSFWSQKRKQILINSSISK